MSTLASPDVFDADRVEAIAARLDLREPNREALISIVCEMARHYQIDCQPPPFEGVVDVATGVGKTYVLAAAIEYFAAEGCRDFAVVAPGRTILDKTVANFTPGHPKSLLGGMDTHPVVITSENFNTPSMRAVMDDPSQVKLYVFTVQALVKPQTQLGRKTHKFQEGLGQAFYAHLQDVDDLVVFADEHHTYYGPAFSAAIRDLTPRALIGLTATPHPKTPPDKIIYRYPLAAAIADRLVKTPVLVGRKDDRTDPETKLLDGVRLLELKERTMQRWCQQSGAEPVHPVMLVIASNIDEANDIARTVAESTFAGGAYADKVLTVHSDAPDVALEQLAQLEEPSNPYRIVVSVGMLKEGWDVKNVYVIASLRKSVSEILTEQTLGRGLRLPFGRYTDVEILDTLEVLGHERYEDLLRKAGVLNAQFIDRRTRAVLRYNAQGSLVPTLETTTVQAPLVVAASATAETAEVSSSYGSAAPLGMSIQSVEDHAARGEAALGKLNLELPRRVGQPPLRIPQLKMSTIKSAFSLADVTNLEPFRNLGERIAADPTSALRRITLGARIVQGVDGLRHTELVTAQAVDRVESPAALLPLDVARATLVLQVLGASVVPQRPNEVGPAGDVVDAFLRGLGPAAEKSLSSYIERAAAGLVQLVEEEVRKVAARPSFEEVVQVSPFDATRLGRPETSQDRFGSFKKGVGYEGYRKSLYAQDWFDSSPERDVANVLEDEPGITLWVRLQVNDLPILWRDGREYNPDFIAVEQDATHWVIEVKMDREMASADVQGKREAAQRWANHVSADASVGVRWRYLLVGETDVRTAKGSWAALKGLGGA